MNTLDVVVAGKVYTLKALPLRRSRQWRSQFEGLVSRLTTAVQTLTSMSDKEFPDNKAMGQAVIKILGSDLAGLVKEFLGSPDMVAEAVFSYSDEMAADREFIEEHGTDAEMFRALREVLKLAFPFGSMARLGDPGSSSPKT